MRFSSDWAAKASPTARVAAPCPRRAERWKPVCGAVGVSPPVISFSVQAAKGNSKVKRVDIMKCFMMKMFLLFGFLLGFLHTPCPLSRGEKLLPSLIRRVWWYPFPS